MGYGGVGVREGAHMRKDVNVVLPQRQRGYQFPSRKALEKWEDRQTGNFVGAAGREQRSRTGDTTGGSLERVTSKD